MQTLQKHSTLWRHFMAIIGFAVCGTVTSYAQEVKGDTLTTEGKEFLVLFIENGKNKAETGSSRTDLDLYFSSRQDATVTIQNSSSKDEISITKGTIGTLHVNGKNAYVRKENINTVSEKGLFVTSTAPICLYALSVGGASTDAACILPVTALGKDYVLQSYDANRSGTSSDKNIYGGMFAIMAAEDNTVVQITPSVELQNHAANTTFSVTLNRGESYFCKAMGETDKSICGTRVTSNKKVAVFQGNNSCTVQKSQSAYDHNYEQATPTTMLGDTFALVKISEAFDMVRFTALYDNTNVYVNGTKQTTINALNTYEYKLSQDECFVVSSKPVVCNSFLCGISNNTTTNLGDPSMVVNPPIEQMIDTCTFISTTSSNSVINRYFVNIVTRKSEKDKIQLDGVAIDGNQFATFTGNSNFVYSRQELKNGVHTLTGDGCRFMATVYGLGQAESYAYSAGCSAIPIVPEVKIDTLASSCEAMLPYKWRKYDNITLTGLYPDTVKSGKLGVPDTITTLHFTVHYSVETNKDTTVCSNDLPVDWQGFQWLGEGVNYKSLTTIHGCDSLVTLSMFVNEPSDTTYRDTIICKDDLPYNWEGWKWYGAGTKYKELTNKAKCDSIVKVTVKVAEPYSATFNKAICPAQLPYTWDELTWTQAGTKTKYLRTSVGCDSTVTYILQVKSYSTGQKDTAVCSYDLPVTWEGFTWTGADTKSKTLVNSVGCDSIVTLTLKVNLPHPAAKDTDVCRNDLPVVWQGLNWTTADTKYLYLTTKEGCDSTVTLTLRIKEPSYVSKENAVCSNDLPINWEGFYWDQADVKNKYLTNKAGCDSIVTLTLTVNQPSSGAISKTVCSNELPIVWEGYTWTGADVKIKHLTNKAGCDSTLTLTLIVNNPTRGDTTAVECTSFKWYGSTYTTSGNYVHHLVNKAGCDSTLTLHLTINKASKGADSKTVCYNELPLSWEGYVWTEAGTKTKILPNAVGCDSVVTLTLYASKAPQSMATEDVVLCNGESYQWHGQTYTKAGTYYYTLKTKMGCDSVYYTLHITTGEDQTSTTDLSISVADLPYMWNGVKCDKAGQYIAHLSTSLGCDSTAILNLTTFVSPIGAVVDNVCADDSIAIINILYNGTPPNYTYSLQWDALAHDNGFVDLQTTQSAKVETIHVVLPVLPGKVYTRPNHYAAQLIMQAEGVQTRKDVFDIGFDVLYPSWILKQKWDDVLGVLNAGYNDGYQFNQYMWFKDNMQLPEYTTDILYRKGGLLPGDYQAKVTRMDDGISMLTCSKKVVAPPASPAREVSIYPTVVNANQAIVHLNSYMSGVYTIYNSLGHIVQQGAIDEGDNSISLSDLHTGIVIISYTLDNQETKNTKISIRP